ncbi:unnamed protein product [Durusdinium trenchii]|uniref:Uncharacterized protein n=1 Tax=Durusdinium trenchii TaxID=1381693 RepID=A0ABP0HDZ2_9DINO
MPLHPSMRLNLKAPHDHDDHPAGVQPREDAVTLDRYKIDEVIDTTVVKEHPDMPGEKLYYVDPAPAAASTSSDSSSYSDSGSEDEASPKVLIGSKAAKKVPPPTPVDSETGGKAAKQVGSETEGKAAEQVPPPTPVDPEMGGKAKQVPPPPVVEVAGKAVGEQVPPPIAVEMGGKAVGEQVPPPTAVATEARVGDPMLVDQVQDPSKGNSASKDPAEVEAISSEEEGGESERSVQGSETVGERPGQAVGRIGQGYFSHFNLDGEGCFGGYPAGAKEGQRCFEEPAGTAISPCQRGNCGSACDKETKKGIGEAYFGPGEDPCGRGTTLCPRG